jgi:hypothetical protein
MDHHQRHPRFLEDRGGQGRIRGSDPVRAAGDAGRHAEVDIGLRPRLRDKGVDLSRCMSGPTCPNGSGPGRCRTACARCWLNLGGQRRSSSPDRRREIVFDVSAFRDQDDGWLPIAVRLPRHRHRHDRRGGQTRSCSAPSTQAEACPPPARYGGTGLGLGHLVAASSTMMKARMIEATTVPRSARARVPSRSRCNLQRPRRKVPSWRSPPMDIEPARRNARCWSSTTTQVNRDGSPASCAATGVCRPPPIETAVRRHSPRWSKPPQSRDGRSTLVLTGSPAMPEVERASPWRNALRGDRATWPV